MNREQKSEACESAQTKAFQDPAPSSLKRILLRAGWVAPLVVATMLPRSSFGANMSGSHGNGGHHGKHFGQLKKGS